MVGVLPVLLGAHAARRLSITPNCHLFWSLYYNQDTYTIFKMPILQSIYLFYSQVDQVTYGLIRLLFSARLESQAAVDETLASY